MGGEGVRLGLSAGLTGSLGNRQIERRGRGQKGGAQKGAGPSPLRRNFDWKCNLCPVFFVCVCVRSVM